MFTEKTANSAPPSSTGTPAFGSGTWTVPHSVAIGGFVALVSSSAPHHPPEGGGAG